MSCNFATHATCSLTLTSYKYNELQVSFVIKKLSYKASYKTSLFLIVKFGTIRPRPITTKGNEMWVGTWVETTKDI